MKTLTAFVLLVVLSQTSFAQVADRPSGPTAPAHSAFFSSEVAMVLVNKSSPDVLFGLTLSVDHPLPADSTITVQFENPTLPGQIFEVPATIDASGMVMVQSPHFVGIVNHRAYLSRTLVLDSNKQIIGTHDQWIWFDIPVQLRSAYATKIID